MTPFFSIIIPTLNEEYYLPKLLSTLLKQKESNFEILIVDARSKDQTKKVVDEFIPLLPIRFLEVSKKNVAYQRNYGAELATGSYLMFLDADAGISPAFTRNAKKIVMRHKGLVFIPSILPDENNTLDMQIVFNFVNFLIEVSQSMGKPLSSGGSIIFDKFFFLHLGGFDVKLVHSEDHDIIQRAQQWGVKAKFLPNLRVRFSLRRMRKEGRLKLFYKYIVSTAYVLFKGKITKKLYTYEMGGQFYSSLSKKISRRGGEDVVREYITKINAFFKRIFIED